MQGYRIVFPETGHVELEGFHVHEPKDNEVVVSIKFTLISNGTEKACLIGENNTRNIPRRYGYSSVGYVVRKGKKVQSLKEGDRVFANYTGHANYGIRPVSDVIKIPDEVDLENAVFLKLASFPLLALRRSQYEIGESIVIVGTGMLGLLGVQIARICGAVPLIAVGGSRQDRLEKAKVFGADYVVSANDPELVQNIKSIAERHTMCKGANVIIETSGAESALQAALRYASKNARIMINGCNRVVTEPIDVYEYIHKKGVSIIGANNSNRPSADSSLRGWTTHRDYKLMLEWMASGRLDARSLISEYASPQDCKTVFNRLINDREFPLGVLFDWEEFHR